MQNPWNIITVSVVVLTALALACDAVTQLLFTGGTPAPLQQRLAVLLGFAAAAALLPWALLHLPKQGQRTSQLGGPGEDRYKALFSSAADAIFYANLDGRFLEVNAAAERQTGYSRAELLSLHIADIEPGHTPEARDATIAAIQETGAACFESRILRKDGTVYPVELRVVLVEISGSPGLLGVARDISLQNQAKEALEHETLRRRILMEKSRDGIVIIDQEHRVVEATEGFAAMCATPRRPWVLHFYP